MIEHKASGSSRLTQHELNRESVCAQCGKVFLHTGEHVYRSMGDGGRLQMYCSYTCFRVKKKAEEERVRQQYEADCARIRAGEAWKSQYARAKTMATCRDEEVAVTSKEDAKKKLKQAEGNVRDYTAIMLQSAKGTHERHRARMNMNRWKRRTVYLTSLIAALELEEQEDRARCTPEA